MEDSSDNYSAVVREPFDLISKDGSSPQEVNPVNPNPPSTNPGLTEKTGPSTEESRELEAELEKIAEEEAQKQRESIDSAKDYVKQIAADTGKSKEEV